MVRKFKKGDRVKLKDSFIKTILKDPDEYFRRFVREIIVANFRGVILTKSGDLTHIRFDGMDKDEYWAIPINQISSIMKYKKTRKRW